jgi:serine/threonine-protein kinase
MGESSFGPYRVVRKLGQGGMGVVYLGQHQLLGRRAAIKVLLPDLSARPEVVNRFFNEARAVTSISDPGIVQVFDFGYHTDGSAYIVMEYLEGEPLDRRLDRLRRLPTGEALRLTRQIATSLAAAHAQNIVHRDLKPENIFLVLDAEVASGERSKILDFGIAKLSNDTQGMKTSTGLLIGTPKYMSPEQCRGLTEIDHRSDIYSLGCVLFYLLTGESPFDGEGPGDILSAHIREPSPAPSTHLSTIPPEIDAVVLRCLAKPPADRFPSMTALATSLGKLLATLPADAASSATGVTTPDAGRVTAELTESSAGEGAQDPTTLRVSSGEIRTKDRQVRRRRLWLAASVLAGAVGATTALVIASFVEEPAHVAPMPAEPRPVTPPPAAQPIEPPAPPPTVVVAVPAADPAPPTPATQPGSDAPPSEPPAPAPTPTAPTTASDSKPALPVEPAPVATPPVAAPRTIGHGGKHDHAKLTRPGKLVAVPIAPVAAPTPPPPVVSAPPTPPVESPPVVAPLPPPPPPSKCSTGDFAMIYNDRSLSKTMLSNAFHTLEACRAAGAISDTDYKRTKDVLVAR